MKVLLNFLVLLITLSSCSKTRPIDATPPKIIENKTFNSTLLIDGHSYDGTVIRNCVFENITGDGLQIKDVNNLRIENCTFRKISGDAIRFRSSGVSDGVKIIRNKIYDIEENGILAPEGHINTTIQGNIIYNVAINNTSSQYGAPHHGIYFQGQNVTITENEIHDIVNENGNCISIRTCGVISKNRLYGATDHGISYYADHPGNSQRLLIENNLLYDNGKRGINLASNGNPGYHIAQALIRFNTIISNNQSPVGINSALTGVEFDLLGNILIRTDGGSGFVYSTLPYTENKNVVANGDIGFVHFENRNLRLLSTSSAINAAVGVTKFPNTDYDNNKRNAATLDAGAFEFY